jgi:hypothetical protein
MDRSPKKNLASLSIASTSQDTQSGFERKENLQNLAVSSAFAE